MERLLPGGADRRLETRGGCGWRCGNSPVGLGRSFRRLPAHGKRADCPTMLPTVPWLARAGQRLPHGGSLNRPSSGRFGAEHLAQSRSLLLSRITGVAPLPSAMAMRHR